MKKHTNTPVRELRYTHVYVRTYYRMKKVIPQIGGGREEHLVNGIWETGSLTWRKRNLDPYLTPHTKSV